MKDVKAKCKIWKRNKDPLIQFQLFIFYMPACLQKHSHGRAVSIREFFPDMHYGLIVGTWGLFLESPENFSGPKS